MNTYIVIYIDPDGGGRRARKVKAASHAGAATIVRDSNSHPDGSEYLVTETPSTFYETVRRFVYRRPTDGYMEETVA